MMQLFVNDMRLGEFNAIPTFMPDEGQDEVYAKLRNSKSFEFEGTFECNSFKLDYLSPHLRGTLLRSRKTRKMHTRKRMIERAKAMRTNFVETFTFTFRKEGDKYVDERSGFQLIL